MKSFINQEQNILFTFTERCNSKVLKTFICVFLVPGFVTLFVVVEPGPLREALVTKVALVGLVS